MAIVKVIIFGSLVLTSDVIFWHFSDLGHIVIKKSDMMAKIHKLGAPLADGIIHAIANHDAIPCKDKLENLLQLNTTGAEYSKSAVTITHGLQRHVSVN